MDWAGIRNEGLSGFAMTAIPPTIQLPALPHAVTLFMQRSTDESTPLDELAKILETDASLTADQLRQHYHGLELLRKLETKWPAFQLERLARSVDEQHKAMNVGVHNDFPLSRRLACQAEASEAYQDGSLRPVAVA
jgi:hypothetical protein